MRMQAAEWVTSALALVAILISVVSLLLSRRAAKASEGTTAVAQREEQRRLGWSLHQRSGTALEPHVLRRFEALAARAGLSGVHLHTFRHSAASFLLAAGTQTKVVQTPGTQLLRDHRGHLQRRCASPAT